MSDKPVRCVVLADRHHGLSEGVRGLLEVHFEVVVMVADQPSLLESAARLSPELVVVDLSLKRSGQLDWLSELRKRCPEVPIIVLSVHDEPSVRQAALDAGASEFIVKRAIASELLPAVEAVLDGVALRRSEDPS